MDNLEKNVYLFVAELNGYRRGTWEEKAQFGKECYRNRVLPAKTNDDLNEYIWLKRIYKEMDKYQRCGDKRFFHWSVPIEVDASASMLGFMGALLGDSRLLTMTNILGEELDDPWYVEGLSREHIKKALTPKLYGSSRTPQELWTSNNLDFTSEDLSTVNDALKTRYVAAEALKNFIISQVEPQATMKVKIWNDTFTIECNRYRRLGEVQIGYNLYCTDTGSIRKVFHTKTKAVPDLESFKRFFVTLLVHNLDAQVADTVAGKCYAKYGFCIDIHDAFVISPQAADDVRAWYGEEINKIFMNRKQILSDYFQSIGIKGKSMDAWTNVMDTVEPVEEVQCQPSVLK